MAEWAFFSSKPNKLKLNDLFYSLLLLGLATLEEGRRVWWSSSSGIADYMSYVLRQNCEFQVATPSQQDATNCLSQDIVLLYFLWEILIFPLLVWFSLHVNSKYSCGGEFPDISVTMCYEDHIALWSFRIFFHNMDEFHQLCCPTAKSPLLWRVPILSGWNFEEGKWWARRNSQLRKTLADNYVCSKPLRY